MTPLSALLVAFALTHPGEQTKITFKGAITDPFGEPLPGVAVTVDTESKRRFSATTDESGKYQLEIRLPEYERMTIGAQSPGFASASEAFRPFGDDVVWNIALHVGRNWDVPETRVRGRVSNSAGEPIRGALVTLRTALSPNYLEHAMSDEHGPFVIRGFLDRGYYVASAFQPEQGLGVVGVLLDIASDYDPAIEIVVRKVPPARTAH